MELKKNIPCTEKQTGDQLKKLKLKLKIDRSDEAPRKKQIDLIKTYQKWERERERERENYDGDGVEHYQENASVEMEMELTMGPEGGVDGSSGGDGVGSGGNGKSESLE